MKKIFHNLLLALLVCSQSVYANLWGSPSGAWGGNQACEYDQDQDGRYDSEYYIENDKVLSGLRSSLESKRREFSKLKQRYEYYKEKADEAEDQIKQVIRGDAFKGVRSHFSKHLKGESACPEDYQPCCSPNDDTQKPMTTSDGRNTTCAQEYGSDDPPDPADGATPAVQDGVGVFMLSPARDLRYAATPFRFLGGGWPQADTLVIDNIPQSRRVENIASNRGLNRTPANTVGVAGPSRTGGGAVAVPEARGGVAPVDRPQVPIRLIPSATETVAARSAKPAECNGEGGGRDARWVRDRDGDEDEGRWVCEAIEEVILIEPVEQPDPVYERRYRYEAVYDSGGGLANIPAPFCQDTRERANNSSGKVIEKDTVYNYWNGKRTPVGRSELGRSLVECEGRVSTSLCFLSAREAWQVIKNSAGDTDSRKREDCEDGLEDWYDDYEKQYEYQTAMDDLEDEITDLERKLRNGAEDIEDAIAEGTYCPECSKDGRRKKNRPGLIGDILKIGAGALVTGYLGKRAIDQSTRAGYPAPPLTYASMGWPFIQAGLYGMMGGSWGCSNTMYGNQGAGSPYGPFGMMTGGLYPTTGGVFGYPQGMFGNPMGGGMYNSGMFPGGMPGPWGGLMNMPGGFPSMAGLGGQFGGSTPWGNLGNFSPYAIGGMGPFPQMGYPGGQTMPPFFPQNGLNPYYAGVGGVNAGIPGVGTGFNPYGNNPFNPYGNPFNPLGAQGNGLGNYGINSPLIGNQGLQTQIVQQQMAAQQSLMQLSLDQANREQQRMSQLNVLYSDLARIQSQITSLNSGSSFSSGLPFSGTTGSVFGGVNGNFSLPGFNLGGSLSGGISSGTVNGIFPFQLGNPGTTGSNRPPSSSRR